MSWPTTRKYSRTMSEAFPDVRATWSEGWSREPYRIRGWMLAVFIGVSLALLVAYSI